MYTELITGTENSRLDNSKLPGPDGLSPKIIKDIAPIII
jgi:hypothetical protein